MFWKLTFQKARKVIMTRWIPKYIHPPKLNQGIHNLNRPITSNKIGIVMNSLPTNKSPRPDRFTAKFYEIFKKYLISTLLKLFHKIEKGSTTKFIL